MSKVEVFESDLPVVGDSGVEIVKVVENAVIHTADTVGNIAPPIQHHPIIAACFRFQFFGQVFCLLLGDEAGGLNAVNQKL